MAHPVLGLRYGSLFEHFRSALGHDSLGAAGFEQFQGSTTRFLGASLLVPFRSAARRRLHASGRSGNRNAGHDHANEVAFHRHLSPVRIDLVDKARPDATVVEKLSCPGPSPEKFSHKKVVASLFTL